MKTRQFWYQLPERLIAQHPAERRGTERMMVLHRDTGMLEHRHIADIVEYLGKDRGLSPSVLKDRGLSPSV